MICRGLRGGETCSFVEALFSGLDRLGGLFLPADLPRLSPGEVADVLELEFVERAVRLTALLLGDELGLAACERIARGAFDFPVPFREAGERTHVLELFHGPTLAFKDFGARFMARAMAEAGGLRPERTSRITILTATSGDTGSAVAQAFFGMEGIEVVILYPAGRISAIQERQIATLGGNVHALSVRGSFDDCQSLVKGAFQDPDLRRRAGLTTANSMNLGRLLPQAFYYFEAVAAVHRRRPGRDVVVSVPSGNFGNLTAGILAWKMGLGVARFVAATNANDTVPRYLARGVYEPAPTVATLSTAMDVSAPSNWERIEQLFGGDLEAIRARVASSSIGDDETEAAIRAVALRTNSILDPHSAVGYAALEKALEAYPRADGVALATAHPAKFQEAIERALGHTVPLPRSLSACLDLPLRDRPLPVSGDALLAFLQEILGPKA